MTNEELRRALDYEGVQLKHICALKKTVSTMVPARAYIKSGGEPAGIFTADVQTAGRGRLGRGFDSEAGGLYMSLAISARGLCVNEITPAAGVAVAMAIFDMCGIQPRIKWVNDVILSGKKAAGILVQGEFDDAGELSYAVVGIGVNVASRKFPAELCGIVTSIEDECGVAVDFAALAAKITKNFFWCIENRQSTLEYYRRYSFTLGREVTVHADSGAYHAMAREIDDNGNLIVIDDEGNEKRIYFGEVSVKINT